MGVVGSGRGGRAMIIMNFYVTIDKDSVYHVQNAVMGYLGQHHVHTEKGFDNWKKNVDREAIFIEKGQCSCGLKPGEVRDHNGKVTFNEGFGDCDAEMGR
jgi:hypothetical protein